MIITFIGIVIIIIIIVIRFTWLLKVECYDDDVCMIIRACAMCAMYVFSLSGVQQRCATRSGVQQGGSLISQQMMITRQRLGLIACSAQYLPVSWYLSNFALRLL